jgi:hypothetical protein
LPISRQNSTPAIAALKSSIANAHDTGAREKGTAKPWIEDDDIDRLHGRHAGRVRLTRERYRNRGREGVERDRPQDRRALPPRP